MAGRLVIVLMFFLLTSSCFYRLIAIRTRYNQNYRCNSCMSKQFETNWRNLDRIYYRQINFTDQCLQLPTNVAIGTVGCPHSVCISVVEPRILAGHHIGDNIIRGCFSGVFKYGASSRLLRVKQQGPGTSFCMRFRASQLLPMHMIHHGSNRTLRICACFGQLCNNSPIYTDSATISSTYISTMSFNFRLFFSMLLPMLL